MTSVSIPLRHVSDSSLTSTSGKSRRRCNKPWRVRRSKYRFLVIGAAYIIAILVLQLHRFLTTNSTEVVTTAKDQDKASDHLRPPTHINELQVQRPRGQSVQERLFKTVGPKGKILRRSRRQEAQDRGYKARRRKSRRSLTSTSAYPIIGTNKTSLIRVNHKNKNSTCNKVNAEFPPNFFNYQDTAAGGWVVNLLVALYMFGCIAQVCDDYFVPSLEHFCEDLGLSPDVAGATFMAAGSSAPELCTSLIGVFIAQSDVGVGAIVGSSIFNILVIVGFVGLLAGMPLHISWYPVTRDVITYVLSVTILVISLLDNKVEWWESIVMLIMYGFYIMLMVFNYRIRKFFHRRSLARKIAHSKKDSIMRRTSDILVMNLEARSRSRISKGADPTTLKSVEHELKILEVVDTDKKDMTEENLRRRSSCRLQAVEIRNSTNAVPLTTHGLSEDGGNIIETESEIKADKISSGVDDRRVAFGNGTDTPDSKRPTEDSRTSSAEFGETGIGVDEYVSPLEVPEGLIAKVYFFSYLPTTILHAFTIPDSRLVDQWQGKMYVLSFILAVTYIVIYSYMMVWMALYVGEGLSIPDSVVGLTILAAGTSVPDMMSSIYIARDGYGDMAVSNAIGSNIFDILVGLGFPWLLSALISHVEPDDIDNNGMFYTSCTLFATAIFIWALLLTNHWTLNKTLGGIALLAYVITLTLCILVEMNVIFDLHAEEC